MQAFVKLVQNSICNEISLSRKKHYFKELFDLVLLRLTRCTLKNNLYVMCIDTLL